MEKLFRALLLRTLGFKQYLSLVSDIYIRLISAGFMRRKYPELFHLRQAIKPGYVCMDIGANVGYYSTFLSRYAGNDGKVYAVEPVALFAGIFLKNTARFGLPNITLYQTALGAHKGTVTMGTPMINGVLRHGLTRVIDPSEAAGMHTYQVPLEVPDELFASLTRLDFIKCDVEGYEVHLFPHLVKTIARFKPVIQVEISSEENRQLIMNLLLPLGYAVARLHNGGWVKMDSAQAVRYEDGDFYFLPG